jgi:hypothetical protein
VPEYGAMQTLQGCLTTNVTNTAITVILLWSLILTGFLAQTVPEDFLALPVGADLALRFLCSVIVLYSKLRLFLKDNSKCSY